jgi:ribosome-binding factor A
VVSKLRSERIADRIKEELAEMLINDISDPRINGIFVTDVKVDRELSFAEIYISAIEGIQRWNDIKSGLEHAQGFIRRELATRIDMRTFPRVRYHWDPTPERAASIEKLFAELQDEESKKINHQNTGEIKQSDG